MNNPYEASASGAASTPLPRSRGARAHLVISLVIAVFCAVQLVGVAVAILEFIKDARHSGYPDPVPYALLAGKAVMPFTLALAGIFLGFGRKLSAALFAAYLVQYVFTVVPTGRFNLITIGLAVAFLVYALWRWKSGQLTGWPEARGLKRAGA